MNFAGSLCKSNKRSEGKMERELKARLDSIDKTTQRIHACLYGNGNPGNGLTDRLSAMEERLKWLVRIGAGLIATLISVFGADKVLHLNIFP